ncbi:unnamed protein product [Discula destructiva]
MGSYTQPDEVNFKVLVEAIQERAAWYPDNTFMRYPPPDWETTGYRSITWSQYLNGIDKTAHWLDEHLGGPAAWGTFDTVAYAGPNDVRYAFLLPAVVKTKRKMLICDGRITGAGLDGLLNATECKSWLSADDSWTLQAHGATASKMKSPSFPSLEWCLDAVGVPDYPYHRTWEEGKYDDILVIHTSGTTGFPKPITLNNGSIGLTQSTELLAKKHWPRTINLAISHDRVELSVYPAKWGAGIYTWAVLPAYGGTVPVALPPDASGLSPALFQKIVARNHFIQGLSSPPQPLVALWQDAAARELIKTLHYVSFAGASLNQAVGDEIVRYTRLTSLIASTDGGVRFVILPLDRRLWSSMLYVPEAPHRFLQREDSAAAGDGEEDLYELVFDRPADGKPSLFQGAFWNERLTAGKDSAPQSELYSPVKDSDGSTRWIFRARTDDLTKLNFLAKFRAADIEERIRRHPDVHHVVVGGEGRPAPYVLIEIKEQSLERKSEAQLLNEIYDGTVAPNNAKDIEEISIPRETVALGTKDKPFRVNLKHVVLRREVEKDYKEEIEELYARFEKKIAIGVKNGGT